MVLDLVHYNGKSLAVCAPKSSSLPCNSGVTYLPLVAILLC